MHPDNTEHLRRAARDRHEAALARAKRALRELDRAGQPITFRCLAAAAEVSRAWLYKQPALRAEIDRLRTAQAAATGPRLPTSQHGSDESRQRRIEALLEDNTRLRGENTQLRDQVARLLGERRANATAI